MGNKGREYRETRHNIGFSVIERIDRLLSNKKTEKACLSEISIGRLSGGKWVILAKPTTYVNRSGMAVKKLTEHFNVSLNKCLIVVDDFNLSLGMIRFRRNGTDGGHNGLKSIIQTAGMDFPRLRLGIGPVPKDTDVIDFVLGKFNPEELQTKEKTLSLAAEAVRFFCHNGINAAMNKYN